MRIVSWNCKVGFTEEKAHFIKKHKADIYIIQECTNLDIENLNNFTQNKIWYGDNIDSKYGIGIFSDQYSIELLKEHNSDFRYVVPFRIFDKNIVFNLFAIWTKNKNKDNKNIEYTEPTWEAINFDNYKKILTKPVVLIGDFNSNNYWEKEYRRNKKPSHNDIINKLKEFNIESAYHKYNNCENGNEKDPTLLWMMDIDKKYHIDYCFLSNNFKINNVKIGELTEWNETKYSDHCPLIVEIE